VDGELLSREEIIALFAVTDIAVDVHGIRELLEEDDGEETDEGGA
jgi:hypothetical protein